MHVEGNDQERAAGRLGIEFQARFRPDGKLAGIGISVQCRWGLVGAGLILAAGTLVKLLLPG